MGDKPTILKKLIRDKFAMIAIFMIIFGTEIEFLHYMKVFPSSSFLGRLGPINFLFIFAGATILLFRYLQGDRVSSERNEGPKLSPSLRRLLDDLRISMPSKREYEKLYTAISEIKEFVGEEKHIGLGIDEEQRNEIIKLLKKEISETTSASFLTALEEKYAPAVLRKYEYARLLEDFDALTSRLTNEIRLLSRRANSNLAFGSILTFIAMGGLTYVVFKSKVDYSNLTDVLAYYIPRLSFVVFIEIFAYFFLRLYKTNLSDTKYYQNELTNAESKIISLKSALLTEDNLSVQSIIAELSKTERNFVLKKGESTVELEKAKLDVTQLKEIVGIGASLAGQVKKK